MSTHLDRTLRAAWRKSFDIEHALTAISPSKHVSVSPTDTEFTHTEAVRGQRGSCHA